MGFLVATLRWTKEPSLFRFDPLSTLQLAVPSGRDTKPRRRDGLSVRAIRVSKSGVPRLPDSSRCKQEGTAGLGIKQPHDLDGQRQFAKQDFANPAIDRRRGDFPGPIGNALEQLVDVRTSDDLRRLNLRHRIRSSSEHRQQEQDRHRPSGSLHGASPATCCDRTPETPGARHQRAWPASRSKVAIQFGSQWKMIAIYWLAESPQHFAALRKLMPSGGDPRSRAANAARARLPRDPRLQVELRHGTVLHPIALDRRGGVRCTRSTASHRGVH